jgi:hypothetical protein
MFSNKKIPGDKRPSHLPQYAENIIMFLQIGFDELKKDPKQKLNLVHLQIDKNNTIYAIFPSMATQEIRFNKQDNYLTAEFSINPVTGFIEGSKKTEQNIEKLALLYPIVLDEILKSALQGRMLTLEKMGRYQKPNKKIVPC